MKFDKDTILMLCVCLAILFAWEPVARKMGWINPPAEPAQSAPAQPEKTPQTVPAAKENSPATGVAATTEPKSLPELPEQLLQTPGAQFVFSPNRGEIVAVELHKYLTRDREKAIAVKNFTFPGRDYGAMGIFTTEPLKLVQITDNSKLPDGTYRLVRRCQTAGGGLLEIDQTFKPLGDYTLECTVTLKNIGKSAVTLPEFSISAGDLEPWSELSKDTLSRGDTLRIVAWERSDRIRDLDADVKKAEKFDEFTAGNLGYAGTTNRYVASLLSSTKAFTLSKNRMPLPGNSGRYVAGVAAQFGTVVLQPGAEENFPCRYYCGPKVIADLKIFHDSAAKIMNLSWGPLNYLARFLLWVLVQLKAVLGSYGWSIIVLTLIVRFLFWPLTHKSNESMRKMQLLKPKMDEIRKRYKDDPQLMNSKTMELYRTEHINPLSGCMPMLLQIPVFFALYATLDGAVELRQVPFWWSPDLAGPDTVFSFPLGFSFFGIQNFALNPLVLAMTGLMLLQQRLTPSNMDPMQQKMMLAMPVVMLIFLYDLPSGLTLYWTVSSIFSILQLLVQQRMAKRSAAAAVGGVKS
ncbi:MAG: membrane protein insertase YidC [Victivallaceae bacterium]|nr:membrane protein insertase YidC [Victivallaceae bacterium]